MISSVSIWLAFREIINKNPILEINSNTPLVECIGILVLTCMMFIGLTYRWSFSISMLLTVGLQKLMFSKNVSFGLLLSGTILALFPLLPVVGPQPQVYIV